MKNVNSPQFKCKKTKLNNLEKNNPELFNFIYKNIIDWLTYDKYQEIKKRVGYTRKKRRYKAYCLYEDGLSKKPRDNNPEFRTDFYNRLFYLFNTELKLDMKKEDKKHVSTVASYLIEVMKNNRVSAFSRERRCIKAGAEIGKIPDNIQEFLYKKQKGICPLSGIAMRPDYKYTDIDHIIPISRNGKHSLNNLQMTWDVANRSKRNKLESELTDSDYKRIKELVLNRREQKWR